MPDAPRLRVSDLPLRLNNPFRIAHGTSTLRENLFLELDGALGEAAVVPYYPYTADELRRYLEGLDVPALLGDDPFALEAMLDRLPPGPPPARAAADMALHDLWGRRLGQPLYRLWGLRPSDAPPTTFTLALPADEDELRERLEAVRRLPIFKLKLGSGDPAWDEEVVRLTRTATPHPLCVDANGGWSVDDAARLVPRLARYDLLFVEQPIAGPPDAWHALRRMLPADAPPVFADESVKTTADVLPLAGAVDGINIKLSKAGGLREARRMIALARAAGLQVLVGCMVESSIAVTAAAHLAPLADYADLDAPLLVADDPFRGLLLDEGRLGLPDAPGLGVYRQG